VCFEGGYKISARVYDKLFPYQQTAVKWMWELHTQRAGGIIGDEMGLGKSHQVRCVVHGFLFSRVSVKQVRTGVVTITLSLFAGN
jgi:DNA excision repair protein ERCC-6